MPDYVVVWLYCFMCTILGGAFVRAEAHFVLWIVVSVLLGFVGAAVFEFLGG